MKKWCEYIKSRSQNGLVVREEEGGWCLGDWGFSENVLIPEPFVNTYFFIKSLGYMEEMADVISADKTDISILKQKVSEAFVREYYDEKTNSVLNKIQGAEAFFVDLGLGNEDMIKNLNQHYQDIDVFDTGIFGTDILVRVLFENGYQDTAVKLIRNSFAPQIKHGATTLWEYWNGKQSHNHPMYGACVKYLITELMGIKKGETLLIEPKPSALIEKVGIKIKIDEKEVRVSYEIKGGKTLIKVFSEQKAEFSYNNENYTLAENEEKLFVF